MKQNTTKWGVLFFLGMGLSAYGQVGVNTATPKATLDVVGSPTSTTSFDGIIAPRLTGAQLRAKAYTSAQSGALVYVTLADTAPSGQTVNVTSPGYYYFDGVAWQKTSGSALTGSSSVRITGNSIHREALTGDVTAAVNSNATTIANNAVTSAKIADGTIVAADIANATITADKLNQMNAANGQVLKWNGTAWAPGTDNNTNTTYTAGTGLSLNGTTFSHAAHTGDVTGTTSLTIANNAVNSAKIADGSVSTVDLAAGAVTADKLNQMNATSGQVLKWNGTAWAPAADNNSNTTYSAGTGLTLSGTTFSHAAHTGDVTGTTALTIANNAVTNAKIANNAVNSAKIADGTIVAADIANATITADKLNQMNAANGQVLKWNGTAWAPAADNNTNTTYSGSTSITLSGTSFQRAALTGDVTAAVNDNTTTVARIQGRNVASTAPTSGQVLKWNGTAWTPSVDDNSNTNIYSNDGTLSANRTVTMGGRALTFKGGLATFEANSFYPLTINSTHTSGGGLRIMPGGDAAKRIELSVRENGNFRIWAGADRLTVDRTTGNVGIGTGTPAAKLDVAGNIRVQTPGGTWITGKTGNGGITSSIVQTTGYHPFLRQTTSSGHVVNLGGLGDNFGFYIYKKDRTTNGVDYGFIMNAATGNFRIGGSDVATGTTPEAKLEVVGNVKITDLSAGATSDQIVTADANGNLRKRALSDINTTYSAGAGLTLSGTTFSHSAHTGDVTGTTALTIANNAVTNAKIANNAVNSAKIADGSVSTVDLAAGAVTADKLNQMNAANGQVLKWNGTAWAPAADNNTNTTYSGSTSITLSGTSFQRAALTGDVTAAANNNVTTVARIQGRNVANTAPANGQVLKWNGTAWAPAADNNTNTTYSGSTSITLSGTSFQRAALTGDVTAAANNNATTVARIQGRNVANTAPANGQVLKWNGTAWAPAPDDSSNTNIYTTNGTLSGARTVTFNNNNLTFTTGTGQLILNGSTTTNVLLDVNGTIEANAVLYNSDVRLKKDIINMNNATASINGLRTVTYHWNELGKKKGGNDALQYGFIAQEVEKVMPNLVVTDAEGFKSVNYVAVVPVLVKALQEKDTEVKLLKSEVEQMKADLEAIKKYLKK
ncbi:tail fiber domain-containing protein [Bergeyella sp. RCAD1439]|uniref:tail fiber domain-containing protein n=1 Tax=Bergeyella anatis TaxID=3113737 RepID=UPI002E19E0E7|nr:tail fiber domain-containing protein [Bergeyella sp. RCAD1439]